MGAFGLHPVLERLRHGHRVKDGPSSHGARTDQDTFGHVFRRNMPFGTTTRHGTMFVGFCAEQRPLAAMLESMAGLTNGVRDALTRHPSAHRRLLLAFRRAVARNGSLIGARFVVERRAVGFGCRRCVLAASTPARCRPGTSIAHPEVIEPLRALPRAAGAATIAGFSGIGIIVAYVRYLHLDVFAASLGGGNHLGVVLDAAHWSGAAMQRFARWNNLVETTFLLAPTRRDASYRVRIFTPHQEIAFASHPSIGSAHALLECGLAQPRDGLLWQECGAGMLPVRVEGEGASRCLLLRPPPGADRQDRARRTSVAGRGLA